MIKLDQALAAVEEARGEPESKQENLHKSVNKQFVIIRIISVIL